MRKQLSDQSGSQERGLSPTKVTSVWNASGLSERRGCGWLILWALVADWPAASLVWSLFVDDWLSPTTPRTDHITRIFQSNHTPAKYNSVLDSSAFWWSVSFIGRFVQLLLAYSAICCTNCGIFWHIIQKAIERCYGVLMKTDNVSLLTSFQGARVILVVCRGHDLLKKRAGTTGALDTARILGGWIR